MENFMLNKLILSILSLTIVFFLSAFSKAKVKKIQEKNHLSKSRYFIIRRLINLGSSSLLVIILVLIWGVNIKNLWVSITGILAMIAVAFFAVWSLVGNILAGIIIFFTSPFKINDQIEILPDNIKGEVLAINTFFTLIRDAEENLINVPNSLLFQKYVKKIKKKTA
ncbi:MAG: mechanosensitive ion channel family protein [Candidatus Omnitrophica bacterium]|nr:mechanosensitive ion channel family protein [Candidatus Omnitrophota bacterium]MBU4478638.1 mechanosensitive ion channel family protein [Candidatus Omnitrophota bacterium]